MRQTLGISLLLLLSGGCLSTPPITPQLSADADPFRFALSNPFTPPEKIGSEWAQAPTQGNAPDHDGVSTLPVSSPVEAADSATNQLSGAAASTPSPGIDSMPLQGEEGDEFQYESNIVPAITVAELENLLSQSLWVQNLDLVNTLDTGRRPNSSGISPEERKRRDQLRLLNMSPQERARQQNQQYDYVDGSASEWRWMHRGVDRLSATTPPEQRQIAVVFLRDQKYINDPKYRTLRANTAILLGRDGGNSNVAKFLLQLVRDNRTDSKTRCAAIEVLGHMATVTVDDLIPILDDVKERKIETTDRKTGETSQQQFIGDTEIWTELLTAIAEKIDPWEHVCFLEPFYASNSAIRYETAKIWRRKSLQKRPSGTLPEKFLEIAHRESNPMVRTEIIRTLGAWSVPDLFSILEADLNHSVADVRNAAMQALADVRSQEAVPIIKDQLRETNGVTRAAAVSALRKLGAFDEVFKCIDDKDSRVRVEVAQAFGERRNPQTVAFAKSYLKSDRVEVQLATIEAIGGWSIDESGQMLFIAAKSQFSNVRRRATEILAQNGIAYPGFDPDDRPANQTAQYEGLVHIFRELVGVDPNSVEESGTQSPDLPAVASEDFALTEVRRCLDDWQDKTLSSNERQLIQRRLAAHGRRLMPLIDHLLTEENRSIPETLDRVFAEVEPMFVEIEKLRLGDTVAKQKAARELSQLGKANSPPKIAAKRIIDLAVREDDPLVLTSLLAALQNADPELVCELARMLLRSQVVPLRKEACKMLAEFGTGEDVALLRDALRDPSREVVRESLSAIDALSTPEDVDVSVVEALKAMLLQSEPYLQTDTAATLHRLGRSEGTDALRRLAASNDNRLKLYVVRTISDLEDSAFVPILLSFLDDGNGSIKTEALKGLPRAVGQDIGQAGLNPYADVARTQQQIEHWKAWAKEHR